VVNRGKIYFLLPGLFWREGLSQLDKQSDKPKTIAKFLSRAIVKSTESKSLHESIFKQFGLERSADYDLPVASVSLLGLNKKIDVHDCWGCASPVHLLADRDRLFLSKIEGNQITIDEAHKLSACFNRYFESAGIRLHAITPVDWYIKLKDCPKLHTSDLDQVSGRHIQEFMPQGEDGIKFRSLMNEIQMLLYQCNNSSDLNKDRVKVNSLWLSGFGKIPNIYTDFTAVYSDAAVLNGLAKLAGIQCQGVPDDLAALASVDGNLIVLMIDLLDSALIGDASRWIQCLNSLSIKIGRLFDSPALDGNRKIIIDTCDGRSFFLNRRRYVYAFYRYTKELRKYIN
jgi:hypothetical protein